MVRFPDVANVYQLKHAPAIFDDFIHYGSLLHVRADSEEKTALLVC